MFKIDPMRLLKERKSIILIAAAGIAAYVGARAGARPDSALREEIRAIAAHVQQTSYWNVYDDVQRDLLAGKKGD